VTSGILETMAGELRVAVLADTHVRPGRSLPERVWREVRGADVILHAGDVLTRELLDELATVAPVHAVLGNNDRGLERVVPERLELELAGVTVAMVHDAGPRAGRERRVHRWFPNADIVVFGHSHEPVDAEGVDGQRLFNPGSPTQRRRQPHPTLGRIVLAGGRIRHRELVVLPRPDGSREKNLR
jgi:putative phosphoesterase